jgi:hypothetical protein
MRKHSIIFVLLLSALAFARERTLEQLKADAEKAHGGHQAELYSQLALRTVEVADQEFAEGQSVKAQQTIQECFAYATKAHDIALSTRKKRKEVEISLRMTQRRIENVRRTLSVEDRPALEKVEKKLADFRQDILDSIFAPRGAHHK